MSIEFTNSQYSLVRQMSGRKACPSLTLPHPFPLKIQLWYIRLCTLRRWTKKAACEPNLDMDEPFLNNISSPGYLLSQSLWPLCVNSSIILVGPILSSRSYIDPFQSSGNWINFIRDFDKAGLCSASLSHLFFRFPYILLLFFSKPEPR